MNHFLKTSALAVGLVCSAFAAQAQNQPITLKVHHFLGPQTVQHTTMLADWCKNIDKDSKGRLKCEIFPAMQLGGTPAQLFDQARDGVADVVWTAPGYTTGRFARSQVFELPFTMTNAEATSRAAWDFVQKHAQDEYKDVKLLAIHVHGPGVIFTKNKPVTKMEDLKGMKMRGPTATVSKMFASMGATPVGMPVPQVPESLSKGVIDGAVIPWQVAPSLKVHELTGYASETDPKFPSLYTTVFVLPMNKAKYESLPADLKAVIDKNSGRELSATLGRQQAADDIPGRKPFVQQPNYKISMIPASELQRWKEKTAEQDDAWVKDMNKRGHNGQAMLDDALALIKQYTK